MTDSDDLAELRRCKHHTARVRGKPCPVWDCVIRNAAADRIDQDTEAIEEWKLLVKARDAEIERLRAEQRDFRRLAKVLAEYEEACRDALPD